MSNETLTMEQVKALLEGITPGEWAVSRFGFVETPAATVAQFWDKFEEDFPAWEANARLIAAAPALARAYLQMAEERERLRGALDAVYTERAHLVAALSKLFPASLEEHEGEDWDDDWRTVCFIDLPTGQVSWHVAKYDLHLFAHLPCGGGRKWDGHSTPLKYERLAALARGGEGA